MAITKVSALTAKTTPTGSEEVLINDGGTSKKITIANLTKGHDLPTVPSGIDTDTNKEYNLKLTDVSGTETLTWIEETDNDTTYSTVTTSVDGLAPTLPATHGSKFLRGDATWVVPTDTNTTDLASDTTPQLGGDLDVNGNSIVSASNGDIAITPHGTGDVVLDGLKYPQSDGTAGYVLKTDGSAQLSWVAQTTDTDTVYTHPTTAGNEHLPSSVSQTEAGYLDGVTSGIQTQLGAKLPLAGGTMTGDVSLGVNVKAKFGASDDLQIYSDGSNSIIRESGAGALYLDATNLNFRSSNFENYITCAAEAAVTLYHDNLAKLSTTSTGIDVTGSVTCDGFTSTGIDDNATSTAITITSDGRGLSQFTAKAWGKFNGTGTPAYADSHNCSSLTDVGTGHYTINFTNSMANTNYSKVVDCRDVNHSTTLVVAHSSDTYGTGSFHVLLQYLGVSTGAVDEADIHFIVFGD